MKSAKQLPNNQQIVSKFKKIKYLGKHQFLVPHSYDMITLNL